MYVALKKISSRTSVAGTLMALLSRLFRTRSDIIVFGIISGDFHFIYMRYVVCTH